ncbi:unnamed protein product, partial [Choristocarpus tenellus]
AWPVIGVISFACVFCAYWGVKTLATNPEVRISKKERSSILRE